MIGSNQLDCHSSAFFTHNSGLHPYGVAVPYPRVPFASLSITFLSAALMRVW
jgi:hypothetical protein